jgi:hypoxanthine phosphoribosyltransferase
MGDEEGGKLLWKAMPQLNLSDRTVIIVDDIYDEGHTLIQLIKAVESQQPKQVLTAVLVDKQHQRKADPSFKPDYLGLTVPDRYVFGYGMDYQHLWRNAPGIFALKQS